MQPAERLQQPHLASMACPPLVLLHAIPPAGDSVGPRLIPLEPMYLIFNLGMSNDFGMIEYDKLPFPAEMKIDWVRWVVCSVSVSVGGWHRCG